MYKANMCSKKITTVRQSVFAVVLTSMMLTTALPVLQVQPAGAAKPNPAVKPVNKKSDITLNFDEADIRTVIEAVSKHTGLNFIVDPRVKGKVTIISQKPMDADQVYQVFLSILKVHGFAAIPGTTAVKIVPDVNAKQDAIDTVSGIRRSDGDELVTHVIEVRYVDASQMVPILRPLVPQRGHLAAVPSSNVIIISDTAANIARLSSIIRRIDQATGDEIEVFPLRHASATEIVRIVNQLGSKDPKSIRKSQLVADERTNSVLISGDKTSRLQLRALISHLDTPLDVGGSTQVIYLRNAVAKDLVPVLTGVSQNVAQAKGKAKGATAQRSGGSGDISIQADENTNALVITAPPDIFRSLKAVIAKLDVRRAQVLVESIIAEVSQDLSREFGVQWIVDGGRADNPVGVINLGPNPISGLVGLTAPPSLPGTSFGFGDFTGNNRFAALVRLVSSDTDTNVLSTPTLVTLDNEEAEIVVGQNVPFITGSFSNTGGGTTPTNPFQTIERQDVGLTLKIKPQINEGDSIKLDITQEITGVVDSPNGASDLTTSKRSIKTSVMVDDGQIIVLGGLIEDRLTESDAKVPGLGDIPVLGWLFRYKTTRKLKTNLMVFLHPSILKDEKTLLSLTNEKYSYLREQQLISNNRPFRLIGDEHKPLLPEFEEVLSLPPPYEQSSQRLELSNPEFVSKALPPPAVNAQDEGSSQKQQDDAALFPDTPISDDDAGRLPQ